MYCSDGFEEELSGGYIVKADTVEELAAALDLDADTLKKTIDDFNEGAAAGADALGRQGANAPDAAAFLRRSRHRRFARYSWRC